MEEQGLSPNCKWRKKGEERRSSYGRNGEREEDYDLPRISTETGKTSVWFVIGEKYTAEPTSPDVQFLKSEAEEV